MADIIPTPAEPEYFDYREDARKAGVSGDQLRSLQALFEHEYPRDLMLRELHILRACMAIAEGRVSIRTVLAGDVSSAA
jgi:hypothetical protein